MERWSITEEQLRDWEVEAGCGLAATSTVCELIAELRACRARLAELEMAAI